MANRRVDPTVLAKHEESRHVSSSSRKNCMLKTANLWCTNHFLVSIESGWPSLNLGSRHCGKGSSAQASELYLTLPHYHPRFRTHVLKQLQAALSLDTLNKIHPPTPNWTYLGLHDTPQSTHGYLGYIGLFHSFFNFYFFRSRSSLIIPGSCISFIGLSVVSSSLSYLFVCRHSYYFCTIGVVFILSICASSLLLLWFPVCIC